MPPEAPSQPRIIEIFSDDPRRRKTCEDGIYGLRSTREKQRREQATVPPPNVTRHPETK
jgi:hypothetical protein